MDSLILFCIWAIYPWASNLYFPPRCVISKTKHYDDQTQTYNPCLTLCHSYSREFRNSDSINKLNSFNIMQSRIVSLFNVYWPHLVTRGWTRWEAGWSCSRCLCTSGSESPRTGPPQPWSGSPGASPTSASSRTSWSSTLRDSSLSRLRSVTGLNPHLQQL